MGFTEALMLLGVLFLVLLLFYEMLPEAWQERCRDMSGWRFALVYLLAICGGAVAFVVMALRAVL